MVEITTADIWSYLSEIADPEIPVLTIVEMGIVRDVVLKGEGEQAIFEIIITPTYNGCPAMDIISTQIRMTLLGYDINNFKIITRLSPAWTTEWIPEEAQEKMRRFGIAPPQVKYDEQGQKIEIVACPKCHSEQVIKVSDFGSTSCKAMYTCSNCSEPFEHFKCH